MLKFYNNHKIGIHSFIVMLIVLFNLAVNCITVAVTEVRPTYYLPVPVVIIACCTFALFFVAYYIFRKAGEGIIWATPARIALYMYVFGAITHVYQYTVLWGKCAALYISSVL